MLTNSEKEYIISEIQKEQFQENDRIDFKLQWYEKKSALVQDLLSFANTFHHDNCYIVIGIKDGTKEIVGIDDNDKNRKNTQQLTDLIGGLHLAQNSFFSAEVDHLEINEKILDVIIIENSDNTPFFLSKEYENLKKGLVYCRRKDTNTSNDKIATDKEIENLYKKRLHLDQDILMQFKYLLQDLNNWDKYEEQGEPTIIFHKLRPDFYIKYYEDKKNGDEIYEGFSIYECNPEITYYKLELCFHSIKIKQFDLVGLDNSNKKIIFPRLSPKNYFYEYSDSINYYINALLLHMNLSYTPCDLYQYIVLYENEKEREEVESNVEMTINQEELNNLVEENLKRLDKCNSNELYTYIGTYLRTKKIKKYR